MRKVIQPRILSGSSGYIYIVLLSHAWGDITYSNYYKQLLQNVTWEQLPLFICKINTCTIREDSSGIAHWVTLYLKLYFLFLLLKYISENTQVVLYLLVFLLKNY